MVNRFELNGKTYIAKPLDINGVCDLEDYGVSVFGDMDRKKMSIWRAYLAYCGDMTNEEAGIEIGQHIINGGNLDGITGAFEKELKESDFFQSLIQRAEQENPEDTESETEVTEKENK